MKMMMMKYHFIFHTHQVYNTYYIEHQIQLYFL